MGIEIAQRQQLRIDGGHFRRLHAAGSHRLEQEDGAKPVRGQQRLDLRERAASIDR
jgi:hypothetical protein